MKLTRSYKTRIANFKHGGIFLHAALPDVHLLYSRRYRCWLPVEFGAWSMVRCTSERQFRRLLKRWAIYLPSGTRFILTSPYCDAEGRIK